MEYRSEAELVDVVCLGPASNESRMLHHRLFDAEHRTVREMEHNLRAANVVEQFIVPQKHGQKRDGLGLHLR